MSKQFYITREDKYNFIQGLNGVRQITVTITLDEYRALVENFQKDEAIVEKLYEENKVLKSTNEMLLKLLLSEYPELTNSFQKDLQFLIEKLTKIKK